MWNYAQKKEELRCPKMPLINNSSEVFPYVLYRKGKDMVFRSLKGLLKNFHIKHCCINA